jgi:hypothetical protein
MRIFKFSTVRCIRKFIFGKTNKRATLPPGIVRLLLDNYEASSAST